MDSLAHHLLKLSEIPDGTDKRARLTILAQTAQKLYGLVSDGVLEESAALAGLESVADKRDVKRAWNKIKAREHAVPDSVPDDVSVTVLVPGAHFERENEWKIVTPQDFGSDMVAAQSHLYRRSDIVGIMDHANKKFRPLSVPGFRVAVKTRPYLWRQSKETGNRERVYVPLNSDLASIALASAETHSSVRPIKYISSGPVICPNGKLSEYGYNDGGVWCFGTADKYAKDPERAAKPRLSVFDELLVDFPFESQAAKENYILFLLTVIIRPYIDGCVPIFFITSTTERTGKTMLIDVVGGGILLGHPVPAMQFSGSDEEKDKRITACLIAGYPVVHLDNISRHMDSPALASLGTAREYSGRQLGESRMLTLPNSTVWCASGNNVSMTGELSKRSVPIPLLPNTATPHLRTDFKHPDLPAYVRQIRPTVVATLVWMFETWRAAGSPRGTIPMGGFDQWAAVAIGIMQFHGFSNCMTNYQGWTEKVDPEGTDMVRFLEDWIARGSILSRPSGLRERATSLGLFERTLGRASTERGQDTAFAYLLRRYLNRKVQTLDGEVQIVETFNRDGRVYGVCGTSGVLSDGSAEVPPTQGILL